MTRAGLLALAVILSLSACTSPSAEPATATAPVRDPATPAPAKDPAVIPGLTVSAIQARMRTELPSGGAPDPSNSDQSQISYLWPNRGVINVGTGPGASVTGLSCEDDADFRTPLADPFLKLCLDLSYPGADPPAVRSWAQGQIAQKLNTAATANTTLGGQPWQIDFSQGDVEAVYLTIGFAGTGR